MQKPQENHPPITRILGLLTLLAVTPAFAGNPAHLEIQKYRFRRHTNGRFERLVLEFQRKRGIGEAPAVTLVHSGSRVRIKVEGAMIMGGIPESAINESYTNSSRYLGDISLETEGPANGFTVEAKLKKDGTRVEAFWLSKPDRLVLDAYPQGVDSPTNQLKKRRIASHRRPKKKGGGKYYCFPANSHVGLSVLFQPKFRAGDSRVRIDLEASPNGFDSTSDAIVCYPSSAQVEPSIAFHDGRYLTPVPVRPVNLATNGKLAEIIGKKNIVKPSMPRIKLPSGERSEQQRNPSSLLPKID